MAIAKHSLGLILLTCMLASASGAYAQSIVPANDGLQTVVNQIGNQYNITGGTLAGSNLFQSLQKLGLNTSEIANFISNPNIQNILTRVTGGEASLINGLIQVTGGNSNLFIMNPYGIIFGANARLNVPAAFTATTAKGIQVGNGWFGMNTSVDAIKQLTGTPNAFAFANSASLLSQSMQGGTGVILNQANLCVSQGQSIALVGGIVINTGTIETPSGKINIVAVPDGKYVRITSEGSLLSLDLPIATQQDMTFLRPITALDLPNLLTGSGITAPTQSGTAVVSGRLSVDGNSNNNGGVVNVAAQNTDLRGIISARSGNLGGNGGLVETSATQRLSIADTARVDTTAMNGNTGTWILDPVTFTIANFGGDITPATVTVNLQTTDQSFLASSLLSVNNTIDASGNTNPTSGNLKLDAPTINLNAPIILQSGKTLSGTTASTVNVGTSGKVQNGVDVAASGANVNLAATTYTLGSTVNINKNVTLNGTGVANTTVSGNNAVRVFNIGNNSTVNFKDFTVANGRDGGGVYINFGSMLNANKIKFSDNSTNYSPGGAIFNSGTANISNSTFSGNSVYAFRQVSIGGAIYNSGTANISNSTFSGNSANIGGAISNSGTANISNSTFSGNSGGFSSRSPNVGGAISNSGTANISNSTFSGNSANIGGAISNHGTANISNSTFSGNSSYRWFRVSSADSTCGAICNNGTIFLKNTIVAGNTNPNVSGYFVSDGSNLIGALGTATGFLPTDIKNFDDSKVFTELLFPLANNGGSTQTFALRPGSIAINAGNNAGVTTTDQRGFPRISWGRVDIGAYEYDGILPVTTLNLNIDPNQKTQQNIEKRELVLIPQTPVAFILADDIELQNLDRFLPEIVELMNREGGTIEIDTIDIWKDATPSIFDLSVNQDTIRAAILRSIGKNIGNEYVSLVDVKFETKDGKRLIAIVVRKSPKPAKLKANFIL